MARVLYGASLADYMIDAAGTPLPLTTIIIWDAPTGGSKVIDLLDASGSPVADVTSNALGFIRFSGPDGVDGDLWGDGGGPERFVIHPTLLGDRIVMVEAAASAVGATIAALPDTYVAPVAVAVGPGIDRTGATDSGTALQAKVDAITASGGELFIPNGTYKITAPLNFSRKPGWSIRGESRVGTVIKQYTDNVAILNLGSDTASSMHSFAITDLTLDYANTQPSTNTGAVPILFNQMGYNGVIDRLIFIKGTYGIRVAAGVASPWAISFDNLSFQSGLTVGAIHNIDGAGGAPNNKIGRISVDAANMAGPIFSLTGENFVIGALEVFSGFLGPTLMQLAAGTEATIGAFKLENGTYTASQQLFDFLTASKVKVGTMYVGGNALNVSGATTKLTCVRSGAGATAPGHVIIDSLNLSLTTLSGGAQAFAVQPTGATVMATIDNAYLAGGWLMFDQGATVAAQSSTVTSQNRGALSGNLGDANYVATLGGPNKLHFTTAFTAVRNVDLPATNGNLFNGLYYEVILNGAVNGANTCVIRCNSATLRTETADKRVIGYTYRRDPSFAQSGWVLTKYETLP